MCLYFVVLCYLNSSCLPTAENIFNVNSLKVKTELTTNNTVSLLFTSVHIHSRIFGIHFNRFLEIVICFFKFLLIT